MKKLHQLVAALTLLLACSAAVAQSDDWDNGVRTSVTLGWDYLAPDDTQVTEYAFYAADVLPVGTDMEAPEKTPEWTEIVRFPRTAVQVINDAEGNPIEERFKLVDQVPRQRFYVIVAINYWGLESDFSNVAQTPAPVVPRRVFLRIARPELD